jgi:hypothetical protein
MAKTYKSLKVGDTVWDKVSGEPNTIMKMITTNKITYGLWGEDNYTVLEISDNFEEVKKVIKDSGMYNL